MKAVDDYALWGARDYVPLVIEDHWRVLDIGPGKLPLKRANAYLDKDASILAPLEDGKNIILANLDADDLSDIPTKSFDYVFASHVFEHLHDPAKCARTLSRIGKRGTIVMPSVFKDALFHHEERGHEWAVLPNSEKGKPPIFIRYNWDYIIRFRDQLAQKAAAFLYRTGTHHDCTAERHLRTWFQTHEANLDIVFHWEDQLELVVIG